MKRILTITSAIFAAIAASANPINPQKAESIAAQYLIPGHAMQMVKKAARAKAVNIGMDAAKSAPYYIISRGYDQGYVIVAGDDCLPEILGYTESGNFDEDNLPPALKAMLDTWQATVEDAQANGTNTPRNVTSSPALTAGRENIAPFTTSHWHQTGPYNDLCPTRDDNGAKSMTGCVATAISQILYYWRRDLPSTLQASTPTYGMDGYSHASVTQSIPRGTPLKWDLMLDSYSGAPAEYNEAVATMVYAVGTAAHLEYSIEGGTATSGHIEDIPKAISTFFGMNGGWVAYRSSYSQEAWTQLVYSELAKRHPVMYTGVHPSSGGHAVYIDGYQKMNDLMHFNFGWGGQGDGYYTTTLETGMNGFNDYQSCLINAYPKTWNMSASLSTPAHIYANIDNEIKVTIENNSTLDFSGLYCFASSSNTDPTQLSSAKSFDDATVIARDSKGVVTLSVKPTSVRTWYITITDENLNILAKKAVDVEKVETKLSLNKLEVLGTTESETVNGISYSKIYNNKSIVNAYLHNDTDIAFGGIATMNLYASSDNGATFNLVKGLAKTGASIPANGDACISINVTGLETGLLYYVEVDNEWGNTANLAEVANTTETKAYFLSAGNADMTAEMQDNVLRFTGHWDASLYSSFVTRTNNKSAVAYDLTEVIGVGTLPEVSYPQINALIFAKEGAKGCNVVNNNAIQNEALIVAGHDFTPSNDIAIKGKALFDINQQPARWYLTTVPFTVEVPDGIIAREITGHATSSIGISGKTNNVTTLEGGKSYLVMTSSTQRQILTSSPSSDNVLKATPLANTDESFVGTYTATQLPANAKTIKDKSLDKQYFMLSNGEVIEGLRGYFYDAKMTTATSDFRAFSDMVLDPSYLELAKRIQMLYDAQEQAADLVNENANKIMADSIANAEKVFTTQSLALSTDVKKYYTALEKWIEDYKMMAGNDSGAEVDMTSVIINPSFETSATMATGWNIASNDDVAIRKNSNLTYKTVYGDGSNFLYSKAGAPVSQTITLSPGIYTLTAMVGSDENNSITLFASVPGDNPETSLSEKETTVSAHSFGKHYLTEARIEGIEVPASGKLTIGVKAANWFNADNFHITFTGNTVTDAIMEIEQSPASALSHRGIYTLSGVKVSKPTSPGMYIVNGKKTIIR